MHHDVELATGTLARMVSYLRADQSAAGVVASLNHPDEVAAQRTFIVDPILRRPRGPQWVAVVGTTCVLVRGEVFFDVGLYDERFRFHHEDREWSLRAHHKGYKFTFLPEAKVIHHLDAQLRKNKFMIAEHLVSNLWLVYKQGGRRWAVALYWAQRLLTKWLAWRWRRDNEALRRLDDAVVRLEDIYLNCRDENRRPLLPDSPDV
jgi:GT2 family glycosyltransferase